MMKAAVSKCQGTLDEMTDVAAPVTREVELKGEDQSMEAADPMESTAFPELNLQVDETMKSVRKAM